MSSIIMLLSPDEALVATDTLSVDEHGRPRNFTTKAFLVPHLNLIIAGTGLAGFASAWARVVNEQMLVRNLDHLNLHTQQGLNDLYTRNFGEIDGHEVSSSIYQIGIGGDGTIHGYSYSSFYDFKPQALSYGLSMKPTAGNEPDPDSPRSIVQLMHDQRALQDAEDPQRRLYIGGDINLIRLDATGTALTTTLERFHDYEEMESAMYSTFGT